jgi:hypothetical protein
MGTTQQHAGDGADEQSPPWLCDPFLRRLVQAEGLLLRLRMQQEIVRRELKATRISPADCRLSGRLTLR